MEWQRTRFPGCEIKTLLFDHETGLVTALMRLDAGAVLPDHEHVRIEQTYMLEGKLVDTDGPAAGLEVNAGEFVWREPGSRHVAWSPEGGLMLAMFQIPNKFYERDGRVTDLAGKDWESRAFFYHFCTNLNQLADTGKIMPCAGAAELAGRRPAPWRQWWKQYCRSVVVSGTRS
jgi:quercetin dioxygenase-like cupin family protein